MITSKRADGLELIARGILLLAEYERESAAPVRATITVGNVAAEFPGLTPRAFSDAGRRGEFPCFRSGRKLAAKREDVEQWLAGRKVQPRRKAKSIDPAEAYAALVQGGVQ